MEHMASVSVVSFSEGLRVWSASLACGGWPPLCQCTVLVYHCVGVPLCCHATVPACQCCATVLPCQCPTMPVCQCCASVLPCHCTSVPVLCHCAVMPLYQRASAVPLCCHANVPLCQCASAVPLCCHANVPLCQRASAVPLCCPVLIAICQWSLCHVVLITGGRWKASWCWRRRWRCQWPSCIARCEHGVTVVVSSTAASEITQNLSSFSMFETSGECWLLVAVMSVHLCYTCAGSDNNTGDDDDGAFQIPDAVFGSAGSHTTALPVNGELTLMWPHINCWTGVHGAEENL